MLVELLVDVPGSSGDDRLTIMLMEKIRRLVGAALFWLSGMVVGIWFSAHHIPGDIDHPVGGEILLLFPVIAYPVIFAFLAIIAPLLLYRASGE